MNGARLHLRYRRFLLKGSFSKVVLTLILTMSKGVCR